jgi:hypothetical protein
MDALNAPLPGRRAAARLLDDREALARAITDRLYAERPALAAKYGAAGREKCLQDLRYTIEHLTPAVDLGEPALFAGYVRWLDELLRARNVDTEEVALSLRLTEAVLRERLAADEADAVVPAIRAGLEALSADGGR